MTRLPWRNLLKFGGYAGLDRSPRPQLDPSEEPPCLIDPQSVQFIIRQQDLRRWGISVKPGTVGGNWDRLRTRLDKTLLYQAFSARIQDNTPWNQTGYWRQVTKENWWRVARCGGVARYFGRYEQLYQTILCRGYDNSEAARPILVHVCRDGRLARHDGWHRLVIAQLLGIPRVKVKTHLVHPDAALHVADYVAPLRKCA